MLVRHIRGQICCYRTPIYKIYASFSHKELEECGFLSVLRERGFLAALNECASALYVEGQELSALRAFGTELGKSQTSEELRLCDYTAAELERAVARRREEAPKRTRVLQTLSISGGLMLVILLL